MRNGFRVVARPYRDVYQRPRSTARMNAGDLLTNTARSYPDRVAWIWDDQTRTYGESDSGRRRRFATCADCPRTRSRRPGCGADGEPPRGDGGHVRLLEGRSWPQRR